MGATRTYELDTEHDKDAQAVFERSQKINEVKCQCLTGRGFLISPYFLDLCKASANVQGIFILFCFRV